MKNLKNFLTEDSESTTLFNIPLNSHEDLENFEYQEEPVTIPKNKKYNNMVIRAGLHKEFVKELFDFVVNLDDKNIPFAGNLSGQIKIRHKDTGFQPEIENWINEWFENNCNELESYFIVKYLFKPRERYGKGSIGRGGITISTSTQELMVCSLVLLGRKNIKNLSIEEATQLILDAKTKFHEIKGVKGTEKLLDQFDNNFNDLATAVSTSNDILELVSKPIAVFWTGKTWLPEIAVYNPKIAKIKNYNSSDIVVKSIDGSYYGFSLKKKSTANAADPTLLNKPITGKDSFLVDMLPKQVVDELEQKKDEFFEYALSNYYKNLDSNISVKEKNELISKIPNAVMNKMLKSKDNKFFEFIGTVLPKYNEFIPNFISLLFRTKLYDLINAPEFKFYLSTGIGQLKKGMVQIEKAETKELSNIVSAISELDNNELKLIKTPGKKNAWESGSNAAKVFFTIVSGNEPLINIEVRYKGSFTANPQFQSVAAPNLKKLFKK